LRLSGSAVFAAHRQTRGCSRAPLVEAAMLICVAASSEKYAGSHRQHSVLMGPVLQRTEARCRIKMVTRMPPVPLSPIQSGELSDGRPGRFPGHQRQCNAVSAIVAGADVARRLGQGTQPARASQRQHPARATSSKPVDCLALWESAMAVRVGTFRAIHSQSRVPVGFEGSGIEK
jgi:hypothetical protein